MLVGARTTDHIDNALAALEMILGAYESQITGARVAFPMANRMHPLERFRGEGGI